MFTHMPGPRWGQDANRSMIELLIAVRDGTFAYPASVSEAEYAAARTLDDCALKAFIGIGCSFGGRWWRGYAREGKRGTVNFADVSARSLKKLDLAGSMLTHGDYSGVVTADAMIYCDPPYGNTTGYGATGAFDTPRFWDWVRRVSAANDVYVSEYAAPGDFECVWSRDAATALDSGRDTGDARTERLFRYRGTTC